MRARRRVRGNVPNLCGEAHGWDSFTPTSASRPTVTEGQGRLPGWVCRPGGLLATASTIPTPPNSSFTSGLRPACLMGQPDIWEFRLRGGHDRHNARLREHGESTGFAPGLPARSKEIRSAGPCRFGVGSPQVCGAERRPRDDGSTVRRAPPRPGNSGQYLDRSGRLVVEPEHRRHFGGLRGSCAGDGRSARPSVAGTLARGGRTVAGQRNIGRLSPIRRMQLPQR